MHRINRIHHFRGCKQKKKKKNSRYKRDRKDERKEDVAHFFFFVVVVTTCACHFISIYMMFLFRVFSINFRSTDAKLNASIQTYTSNDLLPFSILAFT